MKKLLVASFVKEELLTLGAGAGVKLVAAATLDWLQAETERLVQYAAVNGQVTAGGKLQPPAGTYPVMQETDSKEHVRSKDFPVKVCHMAKGWRELSADDKTRHLTELFVSWFALNSGEKSDMLHKLYITPVAELVISETDESDGEVMDTKRNTKAGGDDDMFGL